MTNDNTIHNLLNKIKARSYASTPGGYYNHFSTDDTASDTSDSSTHSNVTVYSSTVRGEFVVDPNFLNLLLPEQQQVIGKINLILDDMFDHPGQFDLVADLRKITEMCTPKHLKDDDFRFWYGALKEHIIHQVVDKYPENIKLQQYCKKMLNKEIKPLKHHKPLLGNLYASNKLKSKKSKIRTMFDNVFKRHKKDNN